MQAEIKADFPIPLDSASELLSDLVDLEDKLTQAFNEVDGIEEAHDIEVAIQTQRRDGSDVVVVRLRNARDGRASDGDDADDSDDGGDDADDSDDGDDSG